MQWLMCGSLGLLVWSCLGISPVFAQSQLPQLRSLTVPTTIAQQPNTQRTPTIVRPGETLRLKLDRLPTEGTLAIFLDQTDITSQVQQTATEFVYQPTLFPIASGDHTVTFYIVKPGNQWSEFTTFSIKVEESPPPSSTPPQSPNPQPNTPTPQPTESPAAQLSTQARDLTITPKLSVNFKSQILDARSPDAGVSDRPTFADLSFTGGISAQYQRGDLNLQTNINLAGSTFQQEALRFGQLGESAPPVDLSDYLIDLKVGSAQFSLGHICYGNHPFLLNSLCTRGLSSKLSINDRLDLSVAHLSTTSIVGFDDILGIANSNNTVTAATLGLQLLKNQAGGIRLETTVMRGLRQPVSDFNAGEVVDAEESRGIGFRLLANDASGRFKLDAGLARSTFTNPSSDAQLINDFDVVKVEPVTRNAWYVEANYDLLKGVPLDATRTLDLSFNFRRERVDPQFGTVGTSVTADRLQTQFGINAAIAGATVQYQSNQSEDNLANIPTVLKTRTRNTSLNVNVPLQTVLNVQNNFLPTLTYSFQKTHQFGVNTPIPELSAFDPTEIPDQITTTRQFGVSWSMSEFNLSYQLSNTFQDNRQLSRENADFKTISHQISMGWQPNPRFNLNLGYVFTSAKSFEEDITRFTSSPTIGITWEMFPKLTLGLNYNRSNEFDSFNQKFSRSTTLEAILTWQFNINALGRTMPASAFIRYGRQANLNRDRIFDLDTNATIQTVNAGLSFSF
ncbi:MAG: hypothetical protein KME43_27295 [Myxacorys chilensis ATA2-1-KO14]|jgi:hypothetical protein|nr:hypothetical protein [Myxacorys chilensis ATA2-1-KO14]